MCGGIIGRDSINASLANDVPKLLILAVSGSLVISGNKEMVSIFHLFCRSVLSGCGSRKRFMSWMVAGNRTAQEKERGQS